jgi:protoporphyrinogen oxidase
MAEKTAIIAGAGPAGLTAAYELLDKTDIKPVIFETTGDIGGISKTANYKGNRIDIGGHRFFSKSDRVMRFWLNIFPLQDAPAKDDAVLGRKLPSRDEILLEYHGDLRELPVYRKEWSADPEKTDKVFLIRQRISRIFFLRRFFDYPISLSLRTVCNLGIFRTVRIALSYARASIFPIKEEKSLEDFMINRFGKELYRTFFKDYTEKVWGIPCSQIRPEWGAQRIKGLSVKKAVIHAIKNLFTKNAAAKQKKTETTLISQFIYPKLGPGQLWEEVAEIIKSKGGRICLRQRVTGLKCEANKISEVQVKNEINGEITNLRADYFFSSMPIKDLIAAMRGSVPEDVRRIADGLVYRDFIMVGLLLRKLKIKNETKIKTVNDIIPDNWIYVQERDVKLGRLQIFNNWSPYMVKDENTVWAGLEYFCTEGDELWSRGDNEFIKFAIDELAKIGIIDKEDVLDSVIIRMPKTYPAYFGSYDELDAVKNYVDKFENLFLIGRNGMHRYNNQDHSMLTAMTAVDNIAAGVKTKDNIWAVNTEQEYHEKK